ncbi:MAG: zinc dependent phospholipase C family protein [Nitrospirae bacterium]|nr:zinc dependent phospholipase C family protein [Nitrospirota bacterium]MCL5422961.1 zinc dependent phospholipase C family protein [Nitrospirota bacterium]
MKIFKLLFILSFLLIPSFAFAWGPLTHIYLGNEIFSLASFLPAGVYALIRKYRHDFLYGNLMADSIIGKKFLPEDKNPHSWEVGLSLLDSAKTQQQKAFVYGYMSHLAADTVAHGSFTNTKRNIGHTLVELRADSIIDKKYWMQAITIDRKVQMRNDIFLEQSLESAFFSFKTNKRIFKSMLLLSCFNKERFGNFIQRNAVDPTTLTRKNIQRLQIESVDRMVDILCNGRDSEVTNRSPMVSIRQPSYHVFI